MTEPVPEDVTGTRGFRELLARRERVLAELATAPMDQRDLRDALDVSRSTAYKALRELEEAGLVARTGDGRYRLTQLGSLAYRRHSEYVAAVGRVTAARSVVEALPDDPLVPLAFVERGHAVVASPHAPERPLDRLDEETDRSNDYRVLSPIAVPRFLPEIHEQVAEGDLVVELLVESGAVEYLREYDRLDEALATPGFDVLGNVEDAEVGL